MTGPERWDAADSHLASTRARMADVPMPGGAGAGVADVGLAGVVAAGAAASRSGVSWPGQAWPGRSWPGRSWPTAPWSGTAGTPRPMPWPVLAMLALAVLAVAGAAYAWMLPWHSLDADHWFVPWLDRIVSDGAVRALRDPMRIDTEGAAGFANYNPPYLYLLIAGSLLAGLCGPLAIVKLVSVAGTVFCAACLFVLLRRFVAGPRATLGAAGVLLLPSVALNAAAWGQTDAIYTGFMLLCVAAALDGAWAAMMLAFGAALAFKLPAVFVGPFLLAVVLRHRAALWRVPLAAVSYLLLLVPALLAGRPASELARVYLDQSGTYRWLSMNVPNPWFLVQHLQLMSYGHGVALGMALAVLGGLGLAGAGLLRPQGRPTERAELLVLAAASVLAMPYLLPKMHDRYFFPADVMTYALAVAVPRRWTTAAAACVQLGSLGAYSSVLFGLRAGTLLGMLAMSVAVAVIGVQVLLLCRPGAAHEAARG